VEEVKQKTAQSKKKKKVALMLKLFQSPMSGLQKDQHKGRQDESAKIYLM
jgi:hypothetical protein